MYMSPDALLKRQGAASDMWSAGCIMAETLSNVAMYSNQQAEVYEPCTCSRQAWFRRQRKRLIAWFQGGGRPDMNGMFGVMALSMPSVCKTLQKCFECDVDKQVSPETLAAVFELEMCKP